MAEHVNALLTSRSPRVVTTCARATRHVQVGSPSWLQRCGPVPCDCMGRETELTLRRDTAESSPSHDNEIPPSVHEVLNTPGEPLATQARAVFESRFGHDFARVRVHTDPAAESAQQLAARAFTVGEHMFFGAGQYQPTTRAASMSLSAADALGAAEAPVPADDAGAHGGRHRLPGEQEAPDTAPPIVSEVLASPGRPLDPYTQAAMGAAFGHDFIRVRIHTDAKAAASAEAVNALAYTVGDHIVFANNRYEPRTGPGRSLLSHELTHVLQQRPTAPLRGALRIGPADDHNESEARERAHRLRIRGSTSGMLVQRQPAGPATVGTLDARARAIIASAADRTVPAAQRAIQVVRSILATYFSADANLVDNVVYQATDPGLTTTVATGPTAKGTIAVGDAFLAGTNQTHFARRVLQVDHELEHIRQHRRGMGGPATRAEREFLAFASEGLATEVAGTGRVTHATRVALIDEALRNYCRLTPELRTRYRSRQAALLAARATHQAASGQPATSPPTCATP